MIPKERVEYDGYYLIDIVSRSGHKSTVEARGYNLKSWLNFEKSLGSETKYRQVSKEEYMKYHWSGTEYIEDPEVTKKPVKRAVKKVAAKKTVKKTPEKKAVKKTPAKKAVKKTESKKVKK